MQKEKFSLSTQTTGTKNTTVQKLAASETKCKSPPAIDEKSVTVFALNSGVSPLPPNKASRSKTQPSTSPNTPAASVQV